MVWTPPKTWTTGEVLSSNDMNLYVGDNTAFLKAAADEVIGEYSYRYVFSRPIATATTVDLDDALGDGTDTSWIRAVGWQIVGGGGGGGAGGATNAVGSGGGGGGTEWGFTKNPDHLRSGGSSSVTVTIGAGGSGGDAGATGAGVDGGTTSIAFPGLTTSVGGGTRGTRSTISQQVDNRGEYGGAGGGSSSTLFSPASGFWRVESIGGCGGNASSIVHADSSLPMGGNGGDSSIGGGGRGGIGRGFIPAGIPTGATGYGGGGGGGAATGIDGANGKQGHAILHFYR